jgi:hypothetical protein
MRIAATILAGASTVACTGSTAPAPSAANAPVEVINLPRHQHGFDARADNDESRRVIRATVSFIEGQLRAPK